MSTVEGVTISRDVIEKAPHGAYRCFEPGMVHVEIPVSEAVYSAIDAALKQRQPVSIIVKSVESGRTVVVITEPSK